MAPSESLTETVVEGQPNLPSMIEAANREAEPNGHGNDLLDGSSDKCGLLHALQSMRLGDFSVRLPGDRTGVSGKIADTFNEIVAANE